VPMEVSNQTTELENSLRPDRIRMTRGTPKKTTLFRDFVMKVTHVVSLSEILASWLENTSTSTQVEKLKNKMLEIESSVHNVMLSDSLSNALSGYVISNLEAARKIADGFNIFIKFRESIMSTSSDSKIWSQIKRGIEEDRNRYDTYTMQSSSSIGRYQSSNKDAIRRRLNGLITNMQRNLKGIKTIKSIDSVIKSPVIDDALQVIRLINGEDIENPNGWIELFSILDEIDSMIDTYLNEDTKIGNIVNDLFDIRSADRTVNANAYLNFLSKPNLDSAMDTLNVPKDCLINTSLFKQFSVEEFLTLVNGAIDESSTVIRNQLQQRLNSVTDEENDRSNRNKKVAQSTPSSDVVMLKGVLAILVSMEFLSMNVDKNDILRILKEFVLGSRGKEGVMDKHSIVTRDENGNTLSSPIKSSFPGGQNKTGAPGVNYSWKRSGILFRSIDIQVLQRFVQQLSAFKKRVEDAGLTVFLSSSREQLIEKLSNIDRYYSENIKQTETNKVLLKQSTRKLKMNAFISYVKIIRGYIKLFVRSNVSFVTEHHRNAFEYVSYWNARANGSTDIRIVNNECRALLKEYYNVRDALISYVNTSVTDETIADVRSTITTIGGNTPIQMDSSQEKAIVDMFDRLVVWVDRRGKVITDLHLRGKQPLREIVMSQLFIMAYVMKGLRFAIAWYALRVAGKYFQKMYDARVYAYEQDPPSVWKFIGIFVMVDIVINAVIFGILLIANMVLSDTTAPIIETVVMKAIYIDYAIVTIVVLVLAGIVGNVVKNKKYFRYKYEGDRGIRAMQTMIMNIYGVIILLPFFRIIAG
jgi:hypothetical protein